MSGTCFFIGHAEVPDDIFPALASAVAQHIVQFQVKEFIVGQYGKFDALAAAAVRQAKCAHAQAAKFLRYAQARAEKGLLQLVNLAANPK